MKRSILFLLLLSIGTLASADTGLVKKLSLRSVQDTMDNLESLVREKGLTVFARIDHAAGAAKARKELPPTQLLIFGNPKAGTALMTSQPSVGIDLPIKMLVWQDRDGKIWLAFNDPAYLAERHGIGDRPAVIEQMTGLLDGLAAAAATP